MIDCLNPFYAFQRKGEKKVILRRDGDRVPAPFLENPDEWRKFELPCGKCVLCHRRRAVELSIRARCEAVMYPISCFVTLTVADEHIEEVFPNRKLTHRPFQLFMKRLRKRLGVDLRYLMCGEYGEETHRPHYHVILFGWMPRDSFYNEYGEYIASRLLLELWPYGHHQVDELNDNRICYVAGYTLKCSNPAYPSYAKWSRRPALGLRYFEKCWQDIYNLRKDYVRVKDGSVKTLEIVGSEYILNNRKITKSVKYFNQKLRLTDEKKFDILHSSNERYCKLLEERSDDVKRKEADALVRRAEVLQLVLQRKKRDFT